MAMETMLYETNYFQERGGEMETLDIPKLTDSIKDWDIWVGKTKKGTVLFFY